MTLVLNFDKNFCFHAGNNGLFSHCLHYSLLRLTISYLGHTMQRKYLIITFDVPPYI